MSINETTPAPVPGGRHLYYTFTYVDGKHQPVPFTTRKVALDELKKGDVIAEEKAWETEDVVVLYKVLRINKKTVSVTDCDEMGLVCYYPSGERKSKLTLWNGRRFDVVNY
jgi:hypothetical protein